MRDTVADTTTTWAVAVVPRDLCVLLLSSSEPELLPGRGRRSLYLGISAFRLDTEAAPLTGGRFFFERCCRVSKTIVWRAVNGR
jgi:hypothetical protein